MNRTRLKDMDVEQLAALFVNCALEQDQAIREGDNAKFNRLYRQMDEVKKELKGRPGDQRRALIPLLGHPNAQVRLKSAIATLALAPTEAKHTLQVISDRQEYPQAADARGMITALDEGSFMPT
jgi:Domain of unknown function (DUF2019)